MRVWSAYAGLMLGRRLRRRPSIEPTYAVICRWEMTSANAHALSPVLRSAAVWQACRVAALMPRGHYAAGGNARARLAVSPDQPSLA